MTTGLSEAHVWEETKSKMNRSVEAYARTSQTSSNATVGPSGPFRLMKRWRALNPPKTGPEVIASTLTHSTLPCFSLDSQKFDLRPPNSELVQADQIP